MATTFSKSMYDDFWDRFFTFHQETKISRAYAFHSNFMIEMQQKLATNKMVVSPAFRSYEDALILPSPRPIHGAFSDALFLRKSKKEFSDLEGSDSRISISDVSDLLYHAYGFKNIQEDKQEDKSESNSRTVPSAGGLYPLSLLLVSKYITGLDDGIYIYIPENHSLNLLTIKTEISDRAFTDERYVPKRGLTIHYMAVFDRSRHKYGPRAYRFVCFEAGHSAQNLILGATLKGISNLPVGGIYDEDLEFNLGFNGVEVSYIYTVNLYG